MTEIRVVAVSNKLFSFSIVRSEYQHKKQKI